MRRTHKFKELNDVAAVVAKASSFSAAAKALGVDRSTLHRWIASGKVPRPRSKPPVLKPAESATELAAAPAVPAAWADAVRAQYSLSATDLELVDLAAKALETAKDVGEAIRSRLAAMAEFRQLVRQLNLETQALQQPAAPPRQVARKVSGDPRAILMAVK